jgi:hypothetical protein
VLRIEVWLIGGRDILESKVGNVPMQLSEVAVQIRRGDAAAERKDSDALVLSGKVAREMVLIGNPFNRGGTTSRKGISTQRVKWL